MLPWAGWIGSLLGWGVTHQVGSNRVFENCAATDPTFIVLLGVAGLAVLATGAGLAAGVWRGGERETPVRRFLGIVGLMLSSLFAIAIVWQTAAAFIIPRCYA